MLQRVITQTDLTTITAAEVVAIGLTFDTYNWLCKKRNAMLELLLDAPSNSREAEDLIGMLSIIAQTIDAYQGRLAIKEAA